MAHKLTTDQTIDRLRAAERRAWDLAVTHSIDCLTSSGDAYFRSFALRAKYTACAISAYNYYEEIINSQEAAW